MIRKLPSNEKFSGTAQLSGSTMIVKFTVRKSDKDDQRYELTSELDFSKVPTDELIKLATRAIVIDLQRKWRVAHVGEKADPTINEYAKVDVNTLLNEPTKRTSADPLTKARKALEGLSKEEITRLLQAVAA